LSSALPAPAFMARRPPMFHMLKNCARATHRSSVRFTTKNRIYIYIYIYIYIFIIVPAFWGKIFSASMLHVFPVVFLPSFFT